MKKRILAALIASALALNIPAFAVSATAASGDTRVSDSSASFSAEIYEGEGDFDYTDSQMVPLISGLISGVSLGMLRQPPTRNITISAGITTWGKVSQLGFRDVQVQRSSNGSSWMVEANYGNYIRNDGAIHTISQPHTVVGNHFYRIQATYYARDYGWFFPTTQSIVHTTSYAWIS